MEHERQYPLGRYRVVEQIEKVKDGYRWRVTAYDDEAAKTMPWSPSEVIRFDAGRVAPTLADAQRELSIGVSQMKDSISREGS